MTRLLIIAFIILCSSGFCEEFTFHLEDREERAIREIFTSMGEKNLMRLLLESGRLNELGGRIQSVPPLELLAYLLIDPALKSNLKKITYSSFKWSAFLDGFGNNMEKEILAGRLFADLPGFAELVGGNLAQIENYARLQDWERFVKCML